MKILNTSSIAALLAGGTIALLPLDSLAELLSGITIAFLVLTTAGYFISLHKPAK